MENVFLHLVNMSITAGWIALAVIILRLFLKKAPKWITVLLWGLVGLRLILPISIESVLSLIPSAETIPPEIVYAQTPQINSGVEVFNSAVNPVISESLAPSDGLTSTNPVQVLLAIATVVWLAGVAGMFIYTLVSYLRLRHRVKVSMAIEKNIYICDDISTPFILGIIKPKIYLPSNLTASEQDYVLRHEKAHIRRKDHLIKPLSFLLLSVYWFNPLLWVAYVLLCRDIELACDEKVIKDMELDDRKEYSNALLNCSVPRRMISACPLAFGEVSVKQRIKSVLNYKKPAFWISLVAIILCIALSVGFLTNPISPYEYKFTVINKSSDIQGMEVTIEDIFSSDGTTNPYLEAKWTNNTDIDYSYKESFRIYRYTDGKWKDTLTTGEINIPQRCKVSAHSSSEHSYDLWNIDLQQTGTYLFEASFRQTTGDIYYTTYYASVEFEITKVPKSISGWSTVTPEQILYNYQGIKSYATTIRQTISKNQTLDKNSVLNVTWYNGSGKTLTINPYKSNLHKTGSEDNNILVNSKDSITIPADGICNITYSLEGLQPLTSGEYTLTSNFLSDTGYKHTEKTVFTINSEPTGFISRGERTLIEGINMEIIEMEISKDTGRQDSAIHISLTNETRVNYVYTPEFCIYKKVDGIWTSTQTNPIYNFDAAYSLQAESTAITMYQTAGFDLSEAGEYMIEIYLYGNDGTKGYLNTEFTLD